MTKTAFDLPRRLVAEGLGTALLLATVIGSALMGERLAGGNLALELFATTLPTGAMLAVLILMFGPVSGAHLNPAVTLAFALRRELPCYTALLYAFAQIAGALAGAALAHLMFSAPLVVSSAIPRTGGAQWLSEGVATFGLVATILAVLRWRPGAVAYAVGLFIAAGYWFTASTSFANPAVTIARAFTRSFAGILPLHVPGFIAAQLIGAVLATLLMTWLMRPMYPGSRSTEVSGI